MNIFQLLTYNIKEHNYILYSSFEPVPSPPGFWKTLKRTFMAWFHKSSIRIIWRNYKLPFALEKKLENHVVFAPISSNNRRALEPIWQRLSSSDYSVFDEDEYIPRQLVYYYSFLYIWPLVWCYLKGNRYERLLMRTYFMEFFQTMGYIVVIEKLLKHSDVRLIVLANDHSCLPRAMICVSKDMGIKTMYVQHCSVTERFPRLPFDYNFLDGEESYLKYRSVGLPNGIVYLAGNPRFDIISRYHSNNNSHQSIRDLKIGIATNELDDENTLHNLVTRLQECGYVNLTFRPHPRYDDDSSWYLIHGCDYSDSNIENPFEFISRMDVVVAGECGIHLDVAMMKKRSICYNTINATPKDWYSYIKNGLIPYAANFNELLILLKDINGSEWKQRVHEKVCWYNAAIGTPYEGHIGEMLADFIRYEQNDSILDFDKKYGFRQKMIEDCPIKVLSL